MCFRPNVGMWYLTFSDLHSVLDMKRLFDELSSVVFKTFFVEDIIPIPCAVQKKKKKIQFVWHL